MSQKRRLAAGIAVLTALLATDAIAQPSAEDRAVAESLFRDAKRLMDEQKFPDACRKLEESQRLDPAAGTALNLAVCHEKEGRIATAWGEFMTALAQARRDGRPERESLARERIQAIEPQLPRLVIEVPAAARVPGLQVMRNGTALNAGGWDTAIPVDPGDVHIEANAPDYKKWTTTIKVELAKTERVTIPKLVYSPAPKPTVTAPVATGSAPVLDKGPPPGPGQKIAGAVIGGLGLVSVGVGAYFGVLAKSQKGKSDDHCNFAGGTCSPAGVDYMDDAKTSARVADITIGIGAVALIAGGYLLLTAPSSSPKTRGAIDKGHVSTVRPVNVGVGFFGNGAQASVQGVW
jgi:hypothetical protein